MPLRGQGGCGHLLVEGLTVGGTPHAGVCGEGSEEELTVVVLGATAKAEERVWRDTACWQELAQLLPARQIHLWMVGPEVSSTAVPPSVAQPRNLNVSLLRLDCVFEGAAPLGGASS
ncbi:hypothetical protein T484DRAFT_1798380 [Baffinella frigidus]|nr:hypothetical protein T484DRAFT_1798380 [Cryptophyta sp. CCMP2293]